MSGAPAGWSSLRELDQQAGRPKGSAFRAFRALEPQLQAGRDFAVLDRAAAPELAPRVYPGSVKLILLSPDCAARVRSALQGT